MSMQGNETVEVEARKILLEAMRLQLDDQKKAATPEGLTAITGAAMVLMEFPTPPTAP